jgi:hypothetical protein
MEPWNTGHVFKEAINMENELSTGFMLCKGQIIRPFLTRLSRVMVA